MRFFDKYGRSNAGTLIGGFYWLFDGGGRLGSKVKEIFLAHINI